MMHHVDYLAIPGAYFSWLGGLRWSDDGEAIEYVTRAEDAPQQFALGAEVAVFLEGYQAAEHPACFGFVLHFLEMLGAGGRGEVPDWVPSGRQPAELARLFRECGRPFFNAGALAARLGKDWPAARVEPDLREVGLRLTLRPTALALRRALGLAEPPAEVPPLRPLIFSARVLKALTDYSTEDLRHWLRTGRPRARDDVTEPIVEAAESARPQSLALVLARLEARQRRQGAQPLITQLMGALTLPPRRLATVDLPTGGYANLATRGHPEHLLPMQFALDSTEFLRRFAERELLYLDREEPNAPTSEELIVVLDQGVRTWGDTRPVLAAAALALGRLAERRGWRLRFATTGTTDQVLDPLETSETDLIKVLEATDLSRNPARALAGALNAPPPRTGLRDVVLLTHARNLAEPEVVALGRGLKDRTRLFGVGVRAEGDVELVEMLGGGTVRRSRCRVPSKQLALPPPRPRRDPCTWTGDVEPIAFPFRLGITRPIEGRLLAFDEAADWLFLGTGTGLVHAWRIDGPEVEVLPRGSVAGVPLNDLDALVGVGGGVVAGGWLGGRLVLVHYDMASRCVRTHVFETRTHDRGITLQYDPELHSVVTRVGSHDVYWAVDLAPPSPGERGAPASHRGTAAIEKAVARQCALDALGGSVPGARLRHPSGGFLVADETSGGILRVVSPDRPPWRIQPRSDGLRFLDRNACCWAEWQGDSLAVSFTPICTETYLTAGTPAPERPNHLQPGTGRGPAGSSFSLRVYRAPDDVPIGNIVDLSDPYGFTLSRDGRFLAYKISDRQFAVRNLDAGPGHCLVTPRGRTHGRLDVELGDDFLLVRTGDPFHLIRWGRSVLERAQGRLGPRLQEEWDLPWRVQDTTRLLREPPEGAPPVLADTKRFVAWGHRGLWAAVDLLSQVVLLDADGELLCVLFLFRDQFAAWMPDGTRLGPPQLLGGPATPDAAERIGATLKRASVPRRDRDREWSS